MHSHACTAVPAAVVLKTSVLVSLCTSLCASIACIHCCACSCRSNFKRFVTASPPYHASFHLLSKQLPSLTLSNAESYTELLLSTASMCNSAAICASLTQTPCASHTPTDPQEVNDLIIRIQWRCFHSYPSLQLFHQPCLTHTESDSQCVCLTQTNSMQTPTK
jgi:hypothetical protein